MENPTDSDLMEEMFRIGASFHEMAISMANIKPITKDIAYNSQGVNEKMEKPLTPLKAIRAKCRDCCGDQAIEIKSCPSQDCILWKFRAGTRPKEGYDKSPLKTIRAYCLSCGELNSSNDIKLCKLKNCPLYHLRFGKGGRNLSDAEKKKRSARLKEARKAKG
ncbi:hypothetical protein [Desulfovibrio gilichinskyi]|uniref:Uncharacterized protein n=1 Tax=Desulfovibrio gilichinskyi TaxID=1519643 RepID=A0A1X7C3C7_9BACT|nr:hypothetical protein [Desulfovibrio gilichinskyi]SME89295.1 hypothetical protein SAMN06295933_0266 [Desulfovibrio gilichinskyi]